MLEFGIRVLISGAIVFVAGVFGLFNFGWACGTAIGFGLLALLTLPEIRNGTYRSAAAAFHGGLDAVAVAVLIASAGRSESLGFLAMLPYSWMAVRHGASWTVGAFAVPCAMVAGQTIVLHSDPTPGLIVQGGAVLLLGTVLGFAAPQIEEEPRPMSAPPVSGDDELLARNRALREAVNLLQRRSEETAHTNAVLRAPSPDAMAQAVRNATLAEGAALFLNGPDGFVPVGQAGLVPEIVEQARTNRELQNAGATVLNRDGASIGAVWVNEGARANLPALANTLAERLKDLIRAVVVRQTEKASEERSELIARADDPATVAAALAQQVSATSLEFGLIGPEGPVPMGQCGPPCGLVDALRNETGTGLAGWAASGAPMVWISDVRADRRLDRGRALRARTSTFALVSLAEGRAYAWAAWSEPGVAKPAAIGELRAAETALNRWIERVKAAA